MSQENQQQNRRREVLFTPAATVIPKRQRFAKTAWYPMDVLSLVAGRGGVGKTTIVLDDIAAMTRGTLPGDYEGQCKPVAISAIEDSPEMLRMRLEAAGADLNKVFFVDVQTDYGEYIASEPLHLLQDRRQLETLIKEHGVGLWVIDPITSLIPGNWNNQSDVRAVLNPLQVFARELAIPIVGIHHVNKGGGRAGEKVSGSHSFRDTVRSVLLVEKDEESGQLVVTQEKANYSQDGGSWAYILQDTQLTLPDGEVAHVGRAIYQGESDTSVQDIMDRQQGPAGEDRKSVAADAQTFIVEYLESVEGETAPVKKIYDDGEKYGYTNKQLTNARARAKDPRIYSQRIGFGDESHLVWSLHSNPKSKLLGKKPEKHRSQEDAIDPIDRSSPGVRSMRSMRSMDDEKAKVTSLFDPTGTDGGGPQ